MGWMVGRGRRGRDGRGVPWVRRPRQGASLLGAPLPQHSRGTWHSLLSPCRLVALQELRVPVDGGHMEMPLESGLCLEEIGVSDTF